MNAIPGQAKSPEEIRHDERGPAQCPRACPFCRRDRARAHVDQLVADGKLVKG